MVSQADGALIRACRHGHVARAPGAEDLDRPCHDADTGEDMRHFIHPRPQGPTENCTWHNGTVVPLKNKAGKPRYAQTAEFTIGN